MTINNIGASVSHNAPDDCTAVIRLGWDMLRTVMIDVHLAPNFQPAALMAIIAQASNARHLYLTIYTDPNEHYLPEMWEGEKEMKEFIIGHGVAFVRAMFKIKTIDIDMVSELNTSKVSGFVSRFLVDSWMGMKRSRDTRLGALMKRILFHTRPTITISAAQDQKTYSNDPFC